MTDDPIKEIRRIRHQISEECGHDPKKLVAHYIEFQKQFASRLIHRAEELDELASRPRPSDITQADRVAENPPSDD